MKLNNFACGIRFTKGFHVEDQMGAIVDDILYTDGSKFNELLFPELQRGDGIRRLINKNNNCQLTITPSDFIFEYKIISDFQKEFDDYLSEFNRIINQIFVSYKIKNIVRFGFIIGSELDQEDDLLSSVIGNIKINYSNTPQDALSLRFNIINKTPIKIGREVTQDFDNTIITYDKASKESKYSFSVDYQKFFNPPLEFIKDAPISYIDFCKKCYKSYTEKYGI
ncbi:hypothetical protein [uncultured Alistipes sp.]|uniref:hypothetical protein n=1 Tax=uncultured Alistipes sp. TaxID=538949 RepID=UPI0025D6A5CC|nr:hypothetical protein [uncultured Alistipes sp.]